MSVNSASQKGRYNRRGTRMEKILEITVGAGRVKSGFLPLDAVELLETLLAALAEEGADPEILRTSNPHITIEAINSTRTALWAEHAKKLRTPLNSFRKHARSCRLGPKGREFVDRATATTSTWGYVDLIDLRGQTKAKVLRFDASYRERFEKKTRLNTISGTDEIYARVIRAGGERPTAKLELLNGESDTYPVCSRDLAKKLGTHLYELVKLRADVTWDRKTLSVLTLTVRELVESWQDVHLADVIEQAGGVLPVKTTFESVEDLLASRRRGN